jgi:hypothetical protein
MDWLKKVPLYMIFFMLGGCASEVYRYPVQWEFSTNTPVVLTTAKTVSFTLDSGYRRTIEAGTQFKKFVKNKQEAILQPLNTVFTVEGAHTHEAYPVLKENRVIGFYLPVERSFSPLIKPIPLLFQEVFQQEREP